MIIRYAPLTGPMLTCFSHFGTFPPLTGTPAALRDLLKGTGIEVRDLKPGEAMSW